MHKLINQLLKLAVSVQERLTAAGFVMYVLPSVVEESRDYRESNWMARGEGARFVLKFYDVHGTVRHVVQSWSLFELGNMARDYFNNVLMNPEKLAEHICTRVPGGRCNDHSAFTSNPVKRQLTQEAVNIRKVEGGYVRPMGGGDVFTEGREF